MSRRTKREVAPPSRTSISYTCPPGVPMPPVAPFPYGGPWFPTPLPSWFASPPSQAMPGSSACPLPMVGMIDVQPDLEEWGWNLVRLVVLLIIRSTSDPQQHVAEGSPSQPINVDNGDVTRTEKRLSWTKDEDLRLVSAWLNNSNDTIESNFKKNDKYWDDVDAAYNSTTPKGRVRHVKQVKDCLVKFRRSGIFVALGRRPIYYMLVGSLMLI